MPYKRSYTSFSTLQVRMLIAILFFTSAAHSQLRQIFKDELAETNEVRKFSFYSAATGYVAFKDFIGFTTDSGRTFTRKYITTSNVNFNGYSNVNITFGFAINGVKAFDQNTIIAYGDYGLVPAILRSTDGGNSFLLVYHSQLYPNVLRTGITDMVFPGNGNTGIAVDADRILRSTDKGVTWTQSFLYPNRLFNALHVVDNNTVFATAPTHSQTGTTNYFFKTIDAGASWTYWYAPTGNVTSMFFLTESKGWANVDGKIYYTSNGGANWTQKNDALVTPFSTHNMKFVNDHTGYALGEAFQVFKTTDSGRIWEPVERDNDFTWLGYTHNDLQVLNDDQLWAGGRHGFIELNTNSSAAPLPAAFFTIDTSGMSVANVVQLKNFSKTNYTYQWFVNSAAVGATYNASYVHDIYFGADTVTLIVSDGVHADTTEKIYYFDAVPYPPPVVNAYLPAVAGAGSQVTITGNFFSKVTGVSFGGIPASSYKVMSLNTIVAVVGAGGNGNVTVTTATGTASKPGFLTSPPPVITGLSPVYAPVGATVTITGSNFSSTPTENLVIFGGVKATVLTAAPNQLTVQVPAGASYAPVTVTVNNHTGYSMQWFSTTFPTTCGLTEYSFDKGKKIPTPVSMSTTITLGVADFDGDGRNDIGVNQVDVHILLNKSSKGSIDFEKVVVEPYPQGHTYAPSATATADLDGDGKPELVTGSYYGYEIKIFRNTSSIGAVSFAAPIKMTHMAAPFNIILQDVDGDGKPDMLTDNIGLFANHVSIYRNISLPGNIAFEPVQEVKIGNGADRMCMADLDGDGKPDLFVGDRGTNVYTFTILRNTSSIGSISFDRVAVPHLSGSYTDGGIGDMDGDGKTDIAITYNSWAWNGIQKPLVIYKNNSTPGNMMFTPVPVDDATTYTKYHVALSDLDGDGKIDLYSAGGAKYMKNTGSPGTISLLPVTGYYNLGDGATNVPNTDWDNDSRPDLILTASNSALYVYRNIMEPDALAGKDTTICEGQSVKLGGVWDAPDQTYAWTSSDPGFTSAIANPVVSPAVNTDYFVTVTNKFGCVSKDTIRITVGGPAPLATAGADAYVCTGASQQIGMTGIAPNTYSWTSIPAGFTSTESNPVVTPANSQTDYILTVNTGSCVAKDTVRLTLSSLPVADAGADKNVCLPLGATIGTTATGGNTYSWTSNPGGFTSTQARPGVFPTESTTYYLEVTSVRGCKSYDTVQALVKETPAAPTLTASGPLSFCQGQSVTLTSSATTDIVWYNTGLVMQGITTPSITVSQSGNYMVRSVNGFCYANSVSLTVNVDALPATPQITANGNTSICQGGSVILTSSATQGNQWVKDGADVPGSTAQTITVTQSGAYTVRVGNGSCYTNSTPVVVTVAALPPAPTITVTGNTTFCNGGSVLFTSSVAQGNQWYKDGVAIPGAMGDQYRAAASGYYTLRYTLNGCLSPAGAVSVAVTAPTPTPVITQIGNSLVSSADSGNQWYLNNVAIPGATGKTWQPAASGDYTVSVTRFGGCAAAFSAPFNYTITAINEPAWGNSLTVSPNPVQGNVEIKYTGNSTRFTATVTDLNGRPVKDQPVFINSCILDLSKLSAGMYIVRVYNTMSREYINRTIIKL